MRHSVELYWKLKLCSIRKCVLVLKGKDQDVAIQKKIAEHSNRSPSTSPTRS